MRRAALLRGLGGCAIAWLAFGWAGAMASLTDDEAIKAAALDYAEGWYAGDEARVATVLHPQMLKRRVVTDIISREQSVQVVDAETLLRATREGRGKPGDEGPMTLRISILDRHGDIAVVRVVSSLYVDYLSMVRWDGRWLILSVLWGTLAAPGD